MTKTVIKKKSGPKRKDRTMDIWIAHGDNLLNKIEGKSKLHKKIKSLLGKLKTSRQPNEQEDILKKLNGTKDDLGEDWSLWLGRINQKGKDKKIRKFKVSEHCYDRLKYAASQSGDNVNLNQFLEALPDLLKMLGIDALEDFYTLHKELLAYHGALEPEGKSTLQSNDEPSDFSILVIVQRILKELKHHKIDNFYELKLIKKKKIEADKYHESIKGQLHEYDLYINNLNEQLQAKDKEISELNDRLENVRVKPKQCLKNRSKNKFTSSTKPFKKSNKSNQ